MFCFPPTTTPAKIGHPWLTYSFPLAPAQMNALLLTYQIQHFPFTYVLTVSTKYSQRNKMFLQFNFHALQTCLFRDIDTIVFAYSFACLYQVTRLELHSRRVLFIHLFVLFSCWNLPSGPQVFSSIKFPLRRDVSLPPESHLGQPSAGRPRRVLAFPSRVAHATSESMESSRSKFPI